ncbi:intraflagellar transport protein 22 homolog [Halichondria panicea]|uniref:intraflagellar transport protein 22 homolog n=1 Tax=Halichondria panicea TaxID=6063 RepID=UPI00312B4FDE
MRICWQQAYSMLRTKILMVGPPESGKSMIANYLGDATESSGGEYNPTQGVRIMEFEWDLGEDPKTGNPLRADVELWDCGGRKEFESCWPAFSKDAGGVMMVYNPDKAQQHLTELEKWYTYFVAGQKLDNSQCVLFAHRKPNAPAGSEEPPPAGQLSEVHCVFTDLEEEPEGIREEFTKLLFGLFCHHRDRQDQEEMRIVGNT